MATVLPTTGPAVKTFSACPLPIGGSLLKCPPLLLAFLGWWPTQAAAQIPVGDGLRGDYYDGIAFAHLTRSRTDGLINFSWQGQPPISGVSPERFTVRWSGWLVPPVTGRYVLHLDVDDGAELWLAERELLSAWRSKSLHSYQVPVDLQAGHAYPLRLDFLQYGHLARVHLRWELPPTTAVRHSWRTLWGVTNAPVLGESSPVETIPTRYLFTRWPATTAAPSTVTSSVAPLGDNSESAKNTLQAQAISIRYRFLGWPAVPPAHPPAVARSAGSSPISSRVAPTAFRPPPMRVKLSEVRVKAPLSARRDRFVTPRTDTLATRLAAGQVLTLRTLYFAQSKADLLPLVQASLDTLAQALAHALRRHPSLRVEVQGHTDNQGDSLLNRQLSQRRAEAVCNYLVSRGIPATCLRPVGRGGTQPIVDNRLSAERPRNRRVVLRPLL